MQIGFSISSTQSTNAPSGMEPIGEVTPVIAGTPTITGTPRVGDVLTATPAATTGLPVPVRSWQWLRSGVPLPGAVGPTHVLTAADEGSGVTVRQTETNSAGTVFAISPVTETIQPALPPAPMISGVPTISGVEVAGEALTATPASVVGPSTRTVQWLRGGTAISGAMSLTYTLQAADVGSMISVQQTETNSEGSDTSTSAATGIIVAAPVAPVAAVLTLNSFDAATGTLDFSSTSGGALYFATFLDVNGTPALNSDGTWSGTVGDTGQAGTLPAAGSGSLSVTGLADTNTDRLSIGLIDGSGQVSQNLLTVTFVPPTSSVGPAPILSNITRTYLNQTNIANGQSQVSSGSFRPDAAGSYVMFLNSNDVSNTGASGEVTVTASNDCTVTLLGRTTASDPGYATGSIWLLEATAAVTSLTFTNTGSGDIDLIAGVIYQSASAIITTPAAVAESVEYHPSGTGDQLVAATLPGLPAECSVVAGLVVARAQTGTTSWNGSWATTGSDSVAPALNAKFQNAVSTGEFAVDLDVNGTTANDRTIGVLAVALQSVGS